MENTEFKVYIEEKTQDYGKLYIEPLERGYGDTLGNALRRLLLSSIMGAAVIAVRIDGVLHEFSTIRGVREDVIEILMNLKHIPIKTKSGLSSDNENAFKIITLDSEELPKDFFTRDENPGTITARDLPWDNEFEFCGNGVLCTLEPNAKLLMEIYVQRGVGYLSAERERPSQPSLPVDALLTDAIFSPVKRVNYQIEPARVGQSIDYERLILEVWTNGALTPDEAVSEAARIAQSYFGQIADTVASAPQVTRVVEEVKEPVVIEVTPKEEENEQFSHPIHELELSIRSENCLLRGGIQTVGDLLQKSRDELLKIRNLGKISLTEIEERLTTLGYKLKPSDPNAISSDEATEEEVVEPVEEAKKVETATEDVAVEKTEETPEVKAPKKTKTSRKTAKTPKEPKEPKKTKAAKKTEEVTETTEDETSKVEETKASKSKAKTAKPKTAKATKSKAKSKGKKEIQQEDAAELVEKLSSKKEPEELLADIIKDADEATIPD